MSSQSTGFNGWARPLDGQSLRRGYRLYSINNLKLVRYKEIFPAPAKTDAIDARRILELFQLSDHLPLAKDALQEVADEIKALDHKIADIAVHSELAQRIGSIPGFARLPWRSWPVKSAPYTWA
jgi:hypothetical protein